MITVHEQYLVDEAGNRKAVVPRAVDGVGPIARFEIAVDGHPEWRPLPAAGDGVFDSLDESVDTDVSAIVPPGSHILAVRAFDQAGNSAVHEIESQ